LTLISLVFYGWYNPRYVPLLAASVIFNYFLAKNIRIREDVGTRKRLLFFSIAANVLFLGYFKYSNFFIDTVNTVFQSELHFTAIILPHAISFFTIQQISYLIDSYRSETIEHSFLDYCLFVTYFPKLIAGPIMRFKEFIPQLTAKTLARFNNEKLLIVYCTPLRQEDK
jgi:alginate O-acetyltransferase complex protein AlgI